MSDLSIYSDQAWSIASNFSGILASDTRTLASMIDAALTATRKTALGESAAEIERLRTELSETTRATAAVVDFPATMTTEAKDGRGIVCIRFDTLADAHGFVGALVTCKKLKEQAG